MEKKHSAHHAPLRSHIEGLSRSQDFLQEAKDIFDLKGSIMADDATSIDISDKIEQKPLPLLTGRELWGRWNVGVALAHLDFLNYYKPKLTCNEAKTYDSARHADVERVCGHIDDWDDPRAKALIAVYERLMQTPDVEHEINGKKFTTKELLGKYRFQIRGYDHSHDDDLEPRHPSNDRNARLSPIQEGWFCNPLLIERGIVTRADVLRELRRKKAVAER